MATTSAQVQQLYVAYLGRAADKAGLDYWLDALNGSTTAPATLTLENLRANFVNEQPEYTDAYAGLTRSETVSKIYLQLFGHSADAAGLEYWTTGGGSTVNTDQLLVAFVNGASATDAKIVANKVLVAEVYTNAAGDNYTAADAKSIIAGVDETTASVTGALTDLETLPGIAIPTGVAALKAAAVADAAIVSYETSKAASLVALNDKVVALSEDYTVTLGAVTDTDADGTISYTEALNALTNTTALRTAISTSSTAQLQLNASDATTALTAARADLVKTDVNAVADINAYNAAVTANAALKAPAAADISEAEGALNATFTAKPADLATANTAYKAAVTGATDITTAADLFEAIKDADATTLAAIDKAFSGLSHYSEVKTVAVADAAKDAAIEAQDKAEVTVGSAYVTAAEASTAAAKLVADAQAADALVAQSKAETIAHDAVVDAAGTAHDAVDAAGAVDVSGTATAGVVLATPKADLFYFATAVAATNDFSITNFNKGDAIYVGEGYTFNSSVKVGTDGFYTGTNTAAKEVFFVQDATTKVVSAVIETNAVGHVAGTGAADNVAVITLTGVTSLSDVSYANGIITSNHVAA